MYPLKNDPDLSIRQQVANILVGFCLACVSLVIFVSMQHAYFCVSNPVPGDPKCPSENVWWATFSDPFLWGAILFVILFVALLFREPKASRHRVILWWVIFSAAIALLPKVL